VLSIFLLLCEGNLSNTIINDDDIYQTGKKQLRNAIRQYDQVMMHITARAIAGKFDSIKFLIVGMNFHQAKQHDIEFIEWLVGPSYWQVESQLSSFRQQRSDGTLEWARNLAEFRAWRLSDVVDAPDRRITWIKGSLGLGKSVMAAYFIDLLKCQYSNATVAYFFCRSNQPGLTSARDILRTLAYQCVDNNVAARTGLENLKSKGFQITPGLGIGFLFEKLLLDPLRSTQQIYVVLDGLDEADDVTRDHTDAAGRPELHVLLACLASIPSIRLLCISRPSAQIKAIIPNAFEKTVSKSDNVADIDSFVRTEVSKSPNLQMLFKQDPVQYFREHGDGVFLWVKLVLQQLAKTKTASAFQKYLDGFSTSYHQVTDKLESLYCTILSRISEDDKPWVTEIIRWLLVAKTALTVDTLQALAEWCLEDKMVTFHQFLDETCGSLLQFFQQSDGKGNIVDAVELVHETFKSFIGDPKVCPSSFLVDKPEAECSTTLQCLKCLTSHASASNEVMEYSASNWVDHLSMATANQWRTRVLVALYRFFTSEGPKFWIKQICEPPNYDVNFIFPQQTLPLRAISRWLRDCTIRPDDNTSAATDYSALEVECALKWQRACLDDPSFLEETVGKAAVRLWLHEGLSQGGAVIASFTLGLKYYWRRANRTQSNLEELDELTATLFQNLSMWADPSGPAVPVVRGNLGLAFYAVFQFDKCLQHLRGDNSICDINEQLLPYIAASLFAIRDYDGILEAFDSTRCHVSMDVFRAYRVKREYNRAIDVFQAAFERNPSSFVSWASLFEAYKAGGDFDKMIQISKSALANNLLRTTDAQRHLYEACRGKRNYEEAIRIFQATVDENPKATYVLELLARSYEAAGDYDSAIDKLELGLLDNPRHYQLSSRLVSVVIGKGDYAEATQKLRRGIEKGQMNLRVAVEGLVQAYRKLSDQKGLIAELEAIAPKYRFDGNALHYLCEAYIVSGQYEQAISKSKLAVDNLAVGSYDFPRLFDDLCTACKANGEHITAIEAFESKVRVANRHDKFPEFDMSAILDLYDANHDSARAKKVFEAIVGADDNGGTWGWPGLLRATARDSDFDAIVERVDRLVDDGEMEASWEIARELMNAYCSRGDYDKGIAKLTKIAHQFPLEPWPWHALGQAYSRLGNYEEAIKVYESAIRRIPVDYSLYLSLANLYLRTSAHHRVFECYEVVRDSCPDSDTLAVYTNTTSCPTELVIDEGFCHNLWWFPISEAYKRQGEVHKAHQIFDSVVDKYQKAVLEDNRLRGAYIARTVRSVKYGVRASYALGWLPEYACLCALGEVYKAKQEVKLALETFKKACTWLPLNRYLETVVAGLEQKLQEEINDNKITSPS